MVNQGFKSETSLGRFRPPLSIIYNAGPMSVKNSMNLSKSIASSNTRFNCI